MEKWEAQKNDVPAHYLACIKEIHVHVEIRNLPCISAVIKALITLDSLEKIHTSTSATEYMPPENAASLLRGLSRHPNIPQIACGGFREPLAGYSLPGITELDLSHMTLPLCSDAPENALPLLQTGIQLGTLRLYDAGSTHAWLAYKGRNRIHVLEFTAEVAEHTAEIHGLVAKYHDCLSEVYVGGIDRVGRDTWTLPWLSEALNKLNSSDFSTDYAEITGVAAVKGDDGKFWECTSLNLRVYPKANVLLIDGFKLLCEVMHRAFPGIRTLYIELVEPDEDNPETAEDRINDMECIPIAFGLLPSLLDFFVEGSGKRFFYQPTRKNISDGQGGIISTQIHDMDETGEHGGFTARRAPLGFKLRHGIY